MFKFFRRDLSNANARCVSIRNARPSLVPVLKSLPVIPRFCRPFAPERKVKRERWHRTLQDQLLSELDERIIANLDERFRVDENCRELGSDSWRLDYSRKRIRH